VKPTPEHAKKAEALAERMTDRQSLVVTLMDDVVHMVTKDARPNEAAFRRAYVRCVFAFIEGGVSAMSTYILEGQHSQGEWLLDDDTRRVLWDSVSDPSGDRPEGGRGKFVQRAKISSRLVANSSGNLRRQISAARVSRRSTGLRRYEIG
jgi:hypothetical protein